MVRKYKRKGNKFKWTDEDMRKAIDHARKHQNIAEAARLFGVHTRL